MAIQDENEAISPYIAQYGIVDGIRRYKEDMAIPAIPASQMVAQSEPIQADPNKQSPMPTSNPYMDRFNLIQSRPAPTVQGIVRGAGNALDFLATPPGTQDIANAVSTGFHAPVPTPEQISGKTPIPNIDRIPSAPGTTENPIPGQQTPEQAMFKNPNAGKVEVNPLYQPNFGGGGGGGNPLGGIINEMRTNTAKDIENTRDASNKLNELILEKGDTAEKIARDQALAMGKFIEHNNRLVSMQQKSELAKQQHVYDAMSRVQQARADYMATNIDPQGFWKSSDGSTNIGKEIGGILAIALGSIASTMPGGTGGPNAALAMIDKHIERNIDSQKSNLEKKKYGITVAQNEYGMMRDLLGDEKQANIAARMLLRDQYINKTQEIAANYGTTIAKQNANQIVNEAMLKQKQDEAKLHQEVTAQAGHLTAQGIGLGLQAAGQGLEREKFKREISVQDYMLKNKGSSSVMPGLVTYGTPTTAQTEEAADIYQKARDAKMELKTALEEQEKATLGGRVWTSEEQEAAVNRAALALYKITRGKGARISNDPKDWYQVAGLHKAGNLKQTAEDFRQAIERVDKETNQRLRSLNYGLAPQEK